MNIPKKPLRGQKALQSIYNSVCQIIDYLPSLTVTGDNKTTYVNHSTGGQVIHAVQKDTVIPGGKKEYEAGSGLTLSGNVFNNDVTSGRFIEVTSAYAINCTLSGGNNIEITPNGVINCTLTGGGGGGGNTYYADNFTLSTTSPTGNTFCLYDVYPLITGAGGTTVYRYGDSPLYPDHALGTCISSLYYYGANGIAIEEDGGGSYGAKVSITADFDYHAGTGISIDPTTRTINCTVEPGGGETYYADESTIKLSSTNNTFYLYDVEPLLTGAGGIIVYNYGTDGLSRRVTGISATPYTGGEGISVDNYVISLTATIPTKTSDLTNDSHFITINDVPPGSVYQGDNVTIAASGTNNNIFYVIDGVFAPLTTVVNLSTELSGHIDYVSSNIPLSTSELVNDVPFVTSGDLDAYYKVSAFNAVGDHLQYIPRLGRLNCTLTGGDWIQIDEQDNINCTLTNVSDLNNDAGYITTVDIPPSTTYIGTSGIAIETILDENQQPTTSSFIGLSSQFYNDLTAISTRPATGDKILSSHNGTLSWETNNASSPTWTSLTPSLLAVDNNNHTLSAATQSGGGGGGLNIVYITTQDQRVVVPNTKYCLIPITSLSTNVIDFPNMNPTAISSFETDNNERIYKYFFHGFQSRPDYLYETTSARIDGDVKYGAYDPKNNNWYNYMDGDSHFGNIFIFEPQQQDCVVEIDCGIGGNSLAIAPSGLVWSTFSDDVISGTPQSWYEAWRTDTWPPQKDAGFLQNWRIELVKGNQYMFIYDHNTNMWNMINT